MSSQSHIEWTDATWNPVSGCTKVSSGCAHCYAERISKRWGRDFSKVELHPDRLELPLHWRKPRMIFVNSMSDLFHENVPPNFIHRVYRVMEKCPQHTFQILTKRPERAVDFYGGTSGAGLSAPPLRNVWLGTSIEDQKTADERIMHLLVCPAAIRFLSVEPMLGPIRLLLKWEADGPALLDWVIVGGESGPGARPMHPDWVRSVRDQCKAAGVPFFFKQWGEWMPVTPLYEGRDDTAEDGSCDLEMVDRTGHIYSPQDGQPNDYRTWLMERVGKKRAGAMLDGREHREWPQVQEALA